MIRATIVYFFVGFYIVLVAPFAILWAIFSGNRAIVYNLARFCIRAASLLCGVTVTIRGSEKILAGRTYVFVSNHQGNFDAPVLVHAIPRNWSALIKKEMMRLPLFSLVLKQVQFVPIERNNPKEAQLGIDRGALLLAQGRSFLAFPEGTRSRDGRLGKFKKGAFIMAIKAQTPIIPITILNSARVQPPGKYAMRPGRIDVIFHDPIETAGLTLEDRDTLAQMARTVIAAPLGTE
jgi:1-acyl-sn-glycerol-3-phosphate acyltransferase